MSYPIAEGQIPYAGFSTWYTITGEGNGTPLLTLHGGPGAGSNYLHSLDVLCEGNRKIIYYDQLGCGRSPADSNPSRWTIPFFVDELKTLVQALDLKDFHLFGQSWGGLLAVYYAADNPEHIKSLILANTPVDMPLWDAETQRLAYEMPPPYGEVLGRAIQSGKKDDPAYPEAFGTFFQKHMMHLSELPEMEDESTTEVGQVMEGSVALHTTGNLKDVDATALLSKIKAPTLVIHGEYDLCTDAMVDKMMANLPNAVRCVKLKDSGHIPNIDAPEELTAAIVAFLCEVEA